MKIAKTMRLSALLLALAAIPQQSASQGPKEQAIRQLSVIHPRANPCVYLIEWLTYGSKLAPLYRGESCCVSWTPNSENTGDSPLHNLLESREPALGNRPGLGEFLSARSVIASNPIQGFFQTAEHLESLLPLQFARHLEHSR